MGEETHEPTPNSSPDTNLDPKLSALLAYLLGPVGGIVFFAVSRDGYVKFHAMQSILFSAAMIVIWIGLFIISMVIPFIFMLQWLVWLGFMAISVVLLIKAYQGERFKLPVIGDLAEKYSR